MRQGRDAFHRVLKAQGIPVPELNEMEHKVVDKMEFDPQATPEGEQNTKKGERRAPRGPRRMGWHRMLKQLMLFGHDGTGNFNAQEFAIKMQEFGTQVCQQWNEANGEIEFDVNEPKIRQKFARASIVSQHEDVLELMPGQTTNITIEVRNNSKKVWNDGCTISFAKKQKKLPKGAPMPLETFSVPCEQALAVDSAATFSVPITMGAETPVDNEKIHEVCLSFFNEKSKHFGQMIPIKVKCVEAVQQPAAAQGF